MNNPPTETAVAYRAAQLFLHDKLRAQAISDRLEVEFPSFPKLPTREGVYPLLQKARDANLIRLVPPLAEELAKAIEEKYGCQPRSVRVVDCPAPGSTPSVSEAAADWALELVQELHGNIGRTVGLGLGPGRATRDFVLAFSQRLKENPSIPKLNLIAISAAGPVRQPAYASGSFFNLFPPTRVEEQIGLFAGTLVRSAQIAEMRDRPGYREAIEAVKNIHLVVTSMGDIEDEHALLRIWYDECRKEPKPSWWGQAVGDIQYRPYGNDGFIREKPNDLRAVTLFELEDLVRLANNRDRHVLLIARQCALCDPRRTRAKPLRPILKNPHMRVFSRLIMDSPTAYELLQGE